MSPLSRNQLPPRSESLDSATPNLSKSHDHSNAKHHKILMIFITILVCISFSWYWNKTDFAQMGNGVMGKIYDRNVSQAELQRNMRLLRLGSQLGMRDLVQGLTIGAQSENEALQEFFLESIDLRHEAEELGLTATTTEIANGVKGLVPFQGKDGFDLPRYTEFADNALAPMGFSEAQIEELVADQIALEKLKKILKRRGDSPRVRNEARLRTGLRENGRERGPLSLRGFRQGCTGDR